MKSSSFVALLVAVVCVEQVHSAMWCYRCENEPSNWNCLKFASCADTDKYCVTTTRISGSGNNSVYQLSKKCSPTCPDNKVNPDPGEPASKCCSFSFCNLSGATSVKTSTALTALGILASFFCIFRSGL